MTNLARIFLENGTTLEGLDREAGRLQAEAAEAQARAREGSSWLGGVSGLISGVQGIVTANPAAIGAFTQMAQAYQVYQEGLKLGDISVDLAKNLAEIQAQRTRIATLEKVEILYQQRDQFLAQTEEALHALLLQAERQKLAILLARQRIGTELVALQNLSGRVHFLLGEYASALALEEQDPLRSPDYRLVRDITSREAEEAFHLAHQWVYLAAKSVEYRLNSGSEADLAAIIRTTLRARNSEVLNNSMAALDDALASFYQRQNRVASLEPPHISFRNHLVQRNRMTGANEDTIALAEPLPGGQTSSENWLAFLRSKLSVRANGSPDRLYVPFSTTLDKWPESSDPRFKNPLWRDNHEPTHNDAISGLGVQVQIVGKALTAVGSSARYRLHYLGASAMRQELCVTTGGKDIRYWQVRRPDGSAYLAEGNLGISKWDNSGTQGLNEFSPANDLWILEISASNPDNAELLNQLERIEDIRIRFWTSHFPSNPCP